MHSPPSSPHAYQLRFSWTAWPSGSSHFPESRPASASDELSAAWESDGVRALEWEWTPERVRILFSTRPDVSPGFLCQRAKGRLQHALRKEGDPVEFSRKVSCGSVGNPREQAVDTYLARQLEGGSFADPKYRETLARLAYTNPDVDVTSVWETNRGRYVYALHLVLVTAERVRLPSVEMEKISGALKGERVAEGFEIGRVALMPDHIHLAVRGSPERSPLEIVEAVRDVTGRAVGTLGVWMPTSYMGTFGKYGMAAVRKGVRGG
jgi:REP element-mobilizing transposase RayT